MPLSEVIVEEACLPTDQGAILFDRRRIEQAGADLLDPLRWGAIGDAARGGRGQVWFVRGEFGEAVLRHYRRGGMVGRMVQDSYLWTGAANTRSFREFRLLADLQRRGLPVPAPLAAGYRREGLSYRADLLTARIPAAFTLAERLRQVVNDQAALESLGNTLRRFHAAGVCHADLNAHNLMIDERRRWWLIDFDRGRLRPPAQGWQQRRLQRLLRSLRKLGIEQLPGWRAAWEVLVAAHDGRSG
jgi:3-deoxy-D-manno-octulosonic acid kinase